MNKKIRFYKKLLVEIIETLCSICLYLESDGRHTHNPYTPYMYEHFEQLKKFSTKIRNGEWK